MHQKNEKKEIANVCFLRQTIRRVLVVLRSVIY